MPEVLADGVDYAGTDDVDAWAAAIMAYTSTPERRTAALAKGGPIAASKTWARTADAVLHEVERL